MGGTRLDPRWWVVALVCVGTAVFMLAGMTAAVRSRFSTPTIGREAMVGEMGRAEVDVDPDGVVRIRDALWRARTNRATPIQAGDAVRVVEVQGLVLEVEPETGGARDYRHGSRSGA
jgi:membrane-bound serine protease (ClpP class)